MDGMASFTVSESSGAILVLIGFPGSGKSETGNTVIGKRVFKSEPLQKQVTYDVLDLRLTVRDTTGFESLTGFGEIYNSLKDLDSRKVVFGLTIRIGRFEPGFTETLQTIFRNKEIGEHLSHRTVLIFTCIDELLEIDEEILEDTFKKWLKKAGDINQLIDSFRLKYCVIQNKQRGAKQVKQVEQIVTHIKSTLKNDSELETWCLFNEIVPYDLGKNNMATSTPYEKWNESLGDHDFNQKMNQEIKITPYKVIDLALKLRTPIPFKHTKINIIHGFLRETGSYMTESDVNRLLDIVSAHYSWPCKIL